MENQFTSVDWPAFVEAVQRQRSAGQIAGPTSGATAILFEADGNDGPLFDEGKATHLPRSAVNSAYLHADVAAVVRSLVSHGIEGPCVEMLREICLSGLDLPRRQDLADLDEQLSDTFAVISPPTIRRWLGLWSDNGFKTIHPALQRAANEYDTGLKNPKPSDRIAFEHVVRYILDWISMLEQTARLDHGIIWFMH